MSRAVRFDWAGESGEGPNKVLLGVLGGVVALAGVWFLVINPLLMGGDEAVEPLPVPTRTIAAQPSPTPTTTLVPETFEVFAARDPFQQLVPDSDASGEPGTGGTPAPGGGGTPAPTGSPAPGGSPSPGASPTTSPSPGTGGGGGTGGGSGDAPSDARVGATSIKLVDVFEEDGEPRVLVTVNGTAYRVGEGDTFGGRFKVLDISGDCATFLFGDSRFVLCRGESIRK